MRRRLFRLIPWVSLLLCAASVAGWIRSYVRDDMISLEKTNQHFIASRRGSLAVGDCAIDIWVSGESDLCYVPFAKHYEASWTNEAISLDPDYDHKLGWDHWGWIQNHESPLGYYGREFIVRYWMLSTAFGVLPLIYFLRYIVRRRRYAIGCCQGCGYDLRASPTRCPECGVVAV